MNTETVQSLENSVAKVTINDAYYNMSFDELLPFVVLKTTIRIASIECGSKQTELNLFKDGTFYTFIHEIDKPKTPNETTTSYLAVKKIIQKYADNAEEPMAYSITTRNSNMKKWAETKGREIFNWSNEYEGDDPESQVFEVEIKPQQTS